MEALSKSIIINGKKLTIESGVLAPKANGSVVVKYNDTSVLVTACAKIDNLSRPFLPLTVDFVEKYYSSGKIPGGFYRREGKPSSAATLSARVIDRSIRPFFDKGYSSETHIVATILSYDGSIEPAVLGIIGASTALLISDIPFNKAIAAVNLGFDGSPNFNPDNNLDLIISGSKNKVSMIEGNANQIDESKFMDVIRYSQQYINEIVDIQELMAKEIGKKKISVELEQMDIDLSDLESKLIDNITPDQIYKTIDDFAQQFEENVDKARSEGYKFVRELFRKRALEARIDGRSNDEIRNIDVKIDILPVVHGSSLFTRGETQSLGTVTLGGRDDRQLIDSLEEEFNKRFFLHYNFPPFSVGDAGYMRATGRRELGHGNLSEQAIAKVLPNENDFPYTIRVVSDILSANGSSSMASVCSASLALAAAGVPILEPVAGIALGAINGRILVDINAFEDFLSDLDVKIAGTKVGITAIQIDIKSDGIDEKLLSEIFKKAKEARLFILNKMNDKISKARKELPLNVPRHAMVSISKDKIALLIGPSGKNIKSIIEKTKSSIDISDEGIVNIFSPNKEFLDLAISLVNEIAKDVEVGDKILGKVKKIIEAGAFIELKKGRDGFLHKSQILKNLKDLKISDEIHVKVDNIEARTGRIRLITIK